MNQRPFLLLLMLIMAALACTLPRTTMPTPIPGIGQPTDSSPATTATVAFLFPPTRGPNDPILTPTPDTPRTLPTLRASSQTYTVQPGDTLGVIAESFGVSMQAIMEASGLSDPNLLSVGQSLVIPPPSLAAPGPDFKIIPDSELVNGSRNAGFDVVEYAASFGGYLSTYMEEVEGKVLSGPEIVARLATDYSVNPRLLLAVLEYQGGWLTQTQPRLERLSYPVGLENPGYVGLFKQLTWAANTLNRGYYMWRANAVGAWMTTDGMLIPVSPTINAGTAGVQQVLSGLFAEAQWREAVSERGLYATYLNLFGYPFDWAFEPLIPPGLAQPKFQLPFEMGVKWIFTGGPHGGWDTGSAWAALDFAPPGDQEGCVKNEAWVVAVADGLIVRAEDGAVVQDLDGDGYEQTGWTVLYMHVESRGRVQVGEYLRAGERIGHPSCEGGVSTGTHLHLARRYNGEWISADGALPFVMDGWISVGDGTLYGGYMQRGAQLVEPCECREPENMLQR